MSVGATGLGSLAGQLTKEAKRRGLRIGPLIVHPNGNCSRRSAENRLENDCQWDKYVVRGG